MSVMAKMISKFHESNKDVNIYDNEDERLIAEFLISSQDQNKKLSGQKLLNMTKMRVISSVVTPIETRAGWKIDYGKGANP